MDYSEIRGFNYQPSYGSTSFENWINFNPQVIELELRRGRQYFPKMNTVRLWLSWDAFIRDPAGFKKNFEKELKIVGSLQLTAIPVLFNRWHDVDLDCGGIYIDHFLPKSSGLQRDNLFDHYLETIVGGYGKDPRILAWDICNEPFSYYLVEEIKEIEKAELTWLKRMYDSCKQLGANAPVSISIDLWHGKAGLERIEPLSDILMVHPYYSGNQDNTIGKAGFETLLDGYMEFSRETGKRMLVTETCWGSLDDRWRGENIRYTLTELKKRNIGFIVHALHYSRVADLHGPEGGPVGNPGNLAFINADGSLRPYHDVFNQF